MLDENQVIQRAAFAVVFMSLITGLILINILG